MYPGCTVYAEFSRITADTNLVPNTVYVQEMRQRCNANPLIIGINVETKERETYDVSYVKRIVEKGKPLPLKKCNPFRDRFERGNFCAVERKGSHLEGSLAELLEYTYAKMNIDFPFWAQVDVHKSFELYDKQKEGLVRYEFDFIVVNRKPFVKWAKRNWTKVIRSYEDIMRDHLDCEEEYEDQYWKDVEANMVRELETEDAKTT